MVVAGPGRDETQRDTGVAHGLQGQANAAVAADHHQGVDVGCGRRAREFEGFVWVAADQFGHLHTAVT